MKRKFVWIASIAVVLLICATIYTMIFPPFGSRPTVSFLGYTHEGEEKLAVFQIMNRTRQNIALLPTKLVLQTANGMIDYTNKPQIVGDSPPGILAAQTSVTFALELPAVTNAWSFEMHCMEMRRVSAI